MKFEEKLKNGQYEMLWQEYCGFLDLDLDTYMTIQNRLMQEQLSLWSHCELGKKTLQGKRPETIDEFRKMMPLTTYGDYADVLLQKKAICSRINRFYGFKPPGKAESSRLR